VSQLTDDELLRELAPGATGRKPVVTLSGQVLERAYEAEHEIARRSIRLPPPERIQLSMMVMSPWSREGKHSAPWETAHMFLATNQVIVLKASGFRDGDLNVDHVVDLGFGYSFTLIEDPKDMAKAMLCDQPIIADMLIGQMLQMASAPRSDYGGLPPMWRFRSERPISTHPDGTATDHVLLLTPRVNGPYERDKINDFTARMAARTTSG
jgi:hypothetical protein